MQTSFSLSHDLMPKLRFGAIWLPQREVKTLDGNTQAVICRTYHFRDPNMLVALPGLLSEKFLNQGADLVKVAVYGGADGSDARSLGALIEADLGREAAEKFYFTTIDIDPCMVEGAKRQLVYMNRKERLICHSLLRLPESGGLLRPMASVPLDVSADVMYKVDPFLYNRLDSVEGDLFIAAKKPMDAQVGFCRNMWDHLSKESQKVLAHNLYKNMPDESVLVIGSKSVDAGVRELLCQTGFQQMAPSNSLSAIFIKGYKPEIRKYNPSNAHVTFNWRRYEVP